MMGQIVAEARLHPKTRTGQPADGAATRSHKVERVHNPAPGCRRSRPSPCRRSRHGSRVLFEPKRRTGSARYAVPVALPPIERVDVVAPALERSSAAPRSCRRRCRRRPGRSRRWRNGFAPLPRQDAHRVVEGLPEAEEPRLALRSDAHRRLSVGAEPADGDPPPRLRRGRRNADAGSGGVSVRRLEPHHAPIVPLPRSGGFSQETAASEERACACGQGKERRSGLPHMHFFAQRNRRAAGRGDAFGQPVDGGDLQAQPGVGV
jgi:hypothetical protein